MMPSAMGTRRASSDATTTVSRRGLPVPGWGGPGVNSIAAECRW
jgi:hypothetical protein